jgi:hypothetical protein
MPTNGKLKVSLQHLENDSCAISVVRFEPTFKTIDAIDSRIRYATLEPKSLMPMHVDMDSKKCILSRQYQWRK